MDLENLEMTQDASAYYYYYFEPEYYYNHEYYYHHYFSKGKGAVSSKGKGASYKGKGKGKGYSYTYETKGMSLRDYFSFQSFIAHRFNSCLSPQEKEREKVRVGGLAEAETILAGEKMYPYYFCLEQLTSTPC